MKTKQIFRTLLPAFCRPDCVAAQVIFALTIFAVPWFILFTYAMRSPREFAIIVAWLCIKVFLSLFLSGITVVAAIFLGGHAIKTIRRMRT